MTERRPAQAAPSRADGAGLRVIAKAPVAGDGRRWAAACVAVAIAGAAVGWWLWPARGAAAGAAPPTRVQRDAAAAPVGGPPPPGAGVARPTDAAATPSEDPDDLAAYFRPGDPEPTGAQVIQALHEAGVRTGLGAFNPPGTSPPLLGLAVPEGYELPAGYVRHHQVTDEGVPIEPVLMFAPGFVLRDARGRPIAMPEDRIVPPELAPPGMPQRTIRIPPH